MNVWKITGTTMQWLFLIGKRVPSWLYAQHNGRRSVKHSNAKLSHSAAIKPLNHKTYPKTHTKAFVNDSVVDLPASTNRKIFREPVRSHFAHQVWYQTGFGPARLCSSTYVRDGANLYMRAVLLGPMKIDGESCNSATSHTLFVKTHGHWAWANILHYNWGSQKLLLMFFLYPKRPPRCSMLKSNRCSVIV